MATLSPHRRAASLYRASSLDHPVDAGEQGGWHVDDQRLGVLRLITSSYLVGACTGRSAGCSPLRIRSPRPCTGKDVFTKETRRAWALPVPDPYLTFRFIADSLPRLLSISY